MTRRKPQTWHAELLDWVAVFVALEAVIFLVAWQMYPDWDESQIWPTFFRTLLISGPIALSMWGVSRATRPGSAVPKYMAQKIPYAQVNPDGTTGQTSYTAEHPKKETPSEND